jgi:hypothetical protein
MSSVKPTTQLEKAMTAATVTEIIERGDLNEVLTVVSRLQDFLPEYGRTRTDQKFAEHWKVVEELQNKLSERRALMREEAMRIAVSAARNWSVEEIETACGYSI